MRHRNTALVELAVAAVCWLSLAVSVGWYYTVTYFGRVGWPMPSVETVGALLLYYFSVLNVDTEIQAVHWLVVFPFSGFVWAAILTYSFRNSANTPSMPALAARLGLASVPLSLPMPYMMFAAGQTANGWQLQRMLDVALRRGNIPVWPWLSPMYFALGVASFALHIWIIRRSFSQPILAQIRHVLISSVAFVLAVALMGTLVSFPLRAWLE